ncbi:LysR family transcriptional regulator [Azospirillum doebereinerae]
MDLRRLHQFSVVAEQGSLHRAARRLGLRQPTLSQAIRALETELHIRLFERGPAGTRLTRAGDAFLGEVRGILDALDRAVCIAQRVDSGAGMPLRLGISGDVASGRLTDTLCRFRNSCPQDSLIIGGGTNAHLLSTLQAGGLDLALVPAETTDAGAANILWREEVHLALLATHPLAERDTVELPKLAEHPDLIGSGDPPTAAERALLAACDRVRVTLRLVATAPPLDVRLMLVAAGFGMTALPARSPVLTNGTGLIGRPLHPPVRIVVAAVGLASGPTPAAQRFLALARSPA